MACMTHECIAPVGTEGQCDFFVMDNTRRGQPCPKHGWDFMHTTCDEVPDHNDSRDERDDFDGDDDDE